MRAARTSLRFHAWAALSIRVSVGMGFVEEVDGMEDRREGVRVNGSPLQELVSRTAVFDSFGASFEIFLVGALACLEPRDVFGSRYCEGCCAILSSTGVATWIS